MALLSMVKSLSPPCPGQDYPFPMVNHKEASDHNLQLMKQVREEQQRTAQLTRGERCCSTPQAVPRNPGLWGLALEAFPGCFSSWDTNTMPDLLFTVKTLSQVQEQECEPFLPSLFPWSILLPAAEMPSQNHLP